jgi:uncharacterized peroxidase-related enzyme
LTLAHRPDEFQAFFAYFDALMLKEGGLTKTERETAVNHCIYCVHYSAILKLRAKNPVVADQVAINYRRADPSPRERAMLDFAVKVATESHALRDENFAALHGHGFTNEDIWDIGAITAFFALGSRMANLIAMRPNPEFYSMGRGPK